MRRRSFIHRGASRFGVIGLVGVLVACGVPKAAPQQQPAPPGAPNVLIVITDDQRADDTLHVMPATRRWIKRDGTMFPNAIVTTPLCCPSRASLMTGQYAHNHWVQKNNHGDDIPSVRTLQYALSRNGYRTVLAGKFLNGWSVEDPPPFFDRWIMQQWGYFDSRFNHNGVMREVAEYSVKFIADETIRSLDEFELEDDAMPWFAYVAPFSAHKPYAPQEQYADIDVGSWSGNPAVREKNLKDKPEFVRRKNLTTERARELRRAQLRTLPSVDDLVGRLMSWMEDHQELKDTLVVFTSDNARSWGEHSVDGKRLPYPESAEVPLLLRWPGHFRRGAKDRRLVSNLDVAATIWKAARLKPNHRLDGFPLQSKAEHDRLLLEHWGNYYFGGIPNWASTITRNYQYVEYYNKRGKRFFSEYYNLNKDPWYLRNVLKNKTKKDDPKRLARLRARLARDRHCDGNECP